MKTLKYFLDCWKKDVEVFRHVHPESGIFKYLYFTGLRTVFIFRLSQVLSMWRITRPFAYMLTLFNDLIAGVWIGPGVDVGPGLFLGHPRGLVVNPTARIGSYCSILQRVTIGGPNVTIGSFVEIDANATVVSNARSIASLTIGDNVIVGAGAVVVSDVPSGSVVVGVPAKVVKNLSPEDNWLNFRHRRNRGDAKRGRNGSAD